VDESEEIKLLREQQHALSNVVQGVMNREAVASAQLANLIELFREHRDDSKEFMQESRIALSGIKDQTTRTNGRVNAHDGDIAELKSTVSRAMWWALGINGTVIGGVVLYVLTRAK
jgi:hypothetical protein